MVHARTMLPALVALSAAVAWFPSQASAQGIRRVVEGKTPPPPRKDAPIFSLHNIKGINHAAFSPDSSRIATCSDDETACLWDATNGKPTGSALQHPATVHNVCFSPDGRTLGSASGWDVRFWNTSTQSMLGCRGGSPNDCYNRTVAISPDCRFYLDAFISVVWYPELNMTVNVWAAPSAPGN